MQAGFRDDTRMMRSYRSSVRSNSDAATAYKVATVLLRTTRKARERLAPGPSFIHAELLRPLQRRYYEVLPMLDLEQMLVLRRDPLPKGKNRRCLCTRHFQALRELCPKTIFTFSEFWWLRPQGSRKH
jgi:hypothetical protein